MRRYVKGEQNLEGGAFIIKEAYQDKAFAVFSGLLINGYKGLCLSRAPPDEIKRKYNIDAQMLWMTTQKDQKGDVAMTLAAIRSRAKEFMKRNKKSAVLLDRMDYLVSMFGFNAVMKLIYELSDDAQVYQACMMVNVHPSTLSAQELSVLEQELKQLKGPAVPMAHELPDDLHEIIAYLANSERVSFKEVSKKFGITKTTTRKRIQGLLDKGLVVVKKNGRNKIIRLTEGAQVYM